MAHRGAMDEEVVALFRRPSLATWRNVHCTSQTAPEEDLGGLLQASQGHLDASNRFQEAERTV